MTLRLRTRLLCLFLLLPCLPAVARGQALTQVGLRSVNGQGRFRALRADAAGNLYALLDAADGVRVLKMDQAASAVLAEAHLGQRGDQGIALALDPAGNVYVTGTSLSTGSITGTAGAAFPSRADTTTNSFLIKLSATLIEQWSTFLGSGSMAATGVDASATQVVVTGGIFTNTLPVTPNGIQQQPLPNSGDNGFLEGFSTATGSLTYSTYLSGANGDTTPAAVALDASNNAYVVGTTTASGFPTLNALVQRLLSDSASPVSGFLTKLTPAGDGFAFSTFIPGNGLTSIRVDMATGTLLASGNISPGFFPITRVRAPVAAAAGYQTALRMPLDGSALVSSTLLAPGTVSVIAAANTGFVAAVNSDMANVPPLLPVAPPQSQGSGFLLTADANGTVQQTARVGGTAVLNAGFASVPIFTGGVISLPSGAIFAGGLAPTLSSALRSTERFDVALGPVATSALPSSLRDALPPATCTGSACAGGAALLAQMGISSADASLLLSVDNLPNLTVRNVGSAEATGLQVTASGYTVRSGCAGTLPAGAECDVALTGSGPGSVTASAANAATASANLPANTFAPDALSITPKELDFGITAAATPRTRTLTITNLGSTTQTFRPRQNVTNSHFTLTQSATTCTPVGDGISYLVAAGASCTLTLQLAASSDPANDGTAYATWILGTREVAVTGYTQAASLTLSSAHLGFGRVYSGGLQSPRYLYLSNGSDTVQPHTTVTLPPGLPFKLTDGCPATLAPQSVCQMMVTYASTVVPSSDATTVSIDEISLLMDGQTVPQPGVTGATANPNLSVSPASVAFAQPVVVTTVSSETQSIKVQNTGAAAFPLTVGITGDFTASNCPSLLGGGASCTITVRFTPSDAGTRQGLLSVTAGSSSPVYVTLTGTATAFLPANGVLSFGEVPLATPAVLWFKVSQPFTTLTVASSSSVYGVLLVEDQGYGHGTPARDRFQQSATGSCLNCYLGVQFLPAQAGSVLATLTLSSTVCGSSQTVALSGTGTPPFGVLLSPTAYNFGSVPVGSISGASIFTVTNATTSAIATAAPEFAGDFAQSTITTGGTACGSTLQVGESCSVPVQFNPIAAGPRAGKITVNTSVAAATSTLTGYGDTSPGLTFAPASLLFRNVPDATARQQTITLTNTGNLRATVGTPTSSDAHFAATTTCATLAIGASCAVTVTFNPTDSLSSGTLTLLVTTSPGGAAQTTNYTLALTGLYTAESAGLQIVPGEEAGVNFGAMKTGSTGAPRVFRLNNLSGKALTVSIEAPRQFPVTSTTCGGLPTGGSCTISLAYAPLLNAAATGTLFLQGQPADGTATVNGLAYLQGYGNGAGTLAATGNFTATGVIDFGLVASGQSATEVLTLTNQSTTDTLTVRRVRADYPFQATTTCGATLAPAATCSVSLSYRPNAQTSTSGGANTQSQTGTLILESDAANSPLVVDLAGRTTPSTAASADTPIAALTTSQGSLTFNIGQVGSGSAAQTITVSNTGTVAISIGGVVTSQDFSATNNCAVLPVGASCQVSVSFTPQGAGNRSGSLEIQSNAANALEYVSLLGTGTSASVTLAPTSLAFGQMLVNRASPAQNATFTNTGSGPVTLGSITLSGDFTRTNSGTGIACAAGATVAAGASCVVSIGFTPTQTGTRTGTLTIASSATALPLSTSLSGVGVQPQLSVAPSSLNFGDVLIGRSATLAVTLANVSATDVNALALRVSGADYTATATCGPVTLRAGSSCSVNVTFTPTGPGTRTGVMTITSSDPASPLTLALTGNGLPGGSFTLTANGGASASATVIQGAPANYTLALTPVNGFTGAVALTCTPQTLVQYTACSIVPSTITLTGGTVNATATITTLTAAATAQAEPLRKPRWSDAVLCAFPVLLYAGLRRRQRLQGLIAVGLLSVGLLLAGGCGSGAGDRRIRYAAPGTYQFTVTASSTTGVTASQSVNLTSAVQSR